MNRVMLERNPEEGGMRMEEQEEVVTADLFQRGGGVRDWPEVSSVLGIDFSFIPNVRNVI